MNLVFPEQLSDKHGHPLKIELIHYPREPGGRVNETWKRIAYYADYALVELTKGNWAIIDIDDVDRVKKRSWMTGQKAYGYSGRLAMHRFIIPEESDRIDHINGDTLDNRKSNLRPATHKQNQRNTKLRSDSTTGLKGVCKRRHWGWSAQVYADGKQKFLGHFPTPIEAALAYDKAAIEMFGEFARTNASLGLLP